MSNKHEQVYTCTHTHTHTRCMHTHTHGIRTHACTHTRMHTHTKAIASNFDVVRPGSGCGHNYYVYGGSRASLHYDVSS